MKKRLIPIKDITKAYTKEQKKPELEINMDSPNEDVDKLPKEIFEILGEVVSFIEITNKFEEDNNNENKQ